jgi:uncharacterized membrane protein
MRSTFRLSIPVLLSTVAVAFLVSARPASAQLRLCNRSSETLSMALAYHDGDDWVSRGWFVAQPGECPTVVSGSLRNRYYYVRAEGSSGRRWEGDHVFCAKDARFTHVGDRGCVTDGSDARGFFSIDTGSAASWTQNLTLGAGPDPLQAEHDAIANLRVSWRASLLEDGTYVMQLHNNSSTGADLLLQCYTRSGRSRTMSIQVPGYGVAEVGFLQGWDGNFVAGESCEAYHGREFVWRTNVPR